MVVELSGRRSSHWSRPSQCRISTYTETLNNTWTLTYSRYKNAWIGIYVTVEGRSKLKKAFASLANPRHRRLSLHVTMILFGFGLRVRTKGGVSLHNYVLRGFVSMDDVKYNSVLRLSLKQRAFRRSIDVELVVATPTAANLRLSMGRCMGIDNIRRITSNIHHAYGFLLAMISANSSQYVSRTMFKLSSGKNKSFHLVKSLSLMSIFLSCSNKGTQKGNEQMSLTVSQNVTIEKHSCLHISPSTQCTQWDLRLSAKLTTYHTSLNLHVARPLSRPWTRIVLTLNSCNRYTTSACAIHTSCMEAGNTSTPASLTIS